MSWTKTIKCRTAFSIHFPLAWTANVLSVVVRIEASIVDNAKVDGTKPLLITNYSITHNCPLNNGDPTNRKFMNRTGKIARLPREIREELNRRLADGESGITLLPWLNELPAVAECLAEQFAGDPINKQNLSAWRTGGFAEWEARREMLAQARELASDPKKPADFSTGTITEALSTLLAARYGSFALDARLENGEESVSAAPFASFGSCMA